jgi:hypothetical protein
MELFSDNGAQKQEYVPILAVYSIFIFIGEQFEVEIHKTQRLFVLST